ncbi:MAG: DUF6456 domain-containing protein [Pseudomonadota bacterium]
MNTEEILNECSEQAVTLFGERSACCSSKDAAIYLAHTGRGQSIRAIAAATGTHPSTVMRTVRRIEERRDDPLLDRMLDTLTGSLDAAGAALGEEGHGAAPASEIVLGGEGSEPALAEAPSRASTPEETQVIEEAKRYLRRLSEPESFLLVANGSAKAGVFCAANGHRRPIAMFPVEIAAEFLRRDWIRVLRKGSASMRYRITDVGRAALRRLLMAEAAERRGGRARGFAEAQSPFAGQHRIEAERLFAQPDGTTETLKVNLGESPLGWLARRPGPDGKAYIAPEEVEAGEKLRSDFEMAQLGPNVTQDWRRFLTPAERGGGGGSTPVGSQEARERFTRAMSTLGPGLSDVAFRVCCFLEGLEACEKRMGWSARSGKVVLKLALQRLVEHYGLGAPRV